MFTCGLGRGARFSCISSCLIYYDLRGKSTLLALVVGAALNSRQMAKEVRDPKKRDLNRGALSLLIIYYFLWYFVYSILLFLIFSVFINTRVSAIIYRVNLCIISRRNNFYLSFPFSLGATLGAPNDLVDARKKKKKIMYIAEQRYKRTGAM